MNPARVVIAYLVAAFATTLLFVAWLTVSSGSFHFSELPFLFLLYGVPPLLGASISWMPFVLRSDANSFNRGFYFVAGALSGLVTAVVATAISRGLFQPYLAFAIIGALSALIFREVALTGDETIQFESRDGRPIPQTTTA